MDLRIRETELREQFQANQVQFLLTELETGITFCNVAKSSADPEKIKRNVANACEAYKTLLRFAGRAHFDANSKSEFDNKLERLKSRLRDLGQHV